MLKVTLDSNCANASELVALIRRCGGHVALINTTDREARGTSFEGAFRGIERMPEPGLWGEGGWGSSMWGGGPDVEYRDELGALQEGNPIEGILSVISNGSFPGPGRRGSLTAGELRQLRDAMILCGHVQHGRSIFVTGDLRGYVRDGRRERLQSMLVIQIMTPDEAEDYFRRLEASK
jgi:hypothetical protein